MRVNRSRVRHLYFLIAALVSACSASKLDLSLDFKNDKPLYASAFRKVLGVDEFIDIRPQAATSDAKKWSGFIPGTLWLYFLFEKSVFLPNDRYASIDYRLEGILNRTTVRETGYYYGSSFYAWITRIVGLPYV